MKKRPVRPKQNAQIKISIQNTPKQGVLLVSLSDLQSGSDQAVFPSWGIRKEKTAANDDKPGIMTGSARQKKLFSHFEYCAKEVRNRTGDNRLVVVHDGDAIEGVHHNTMQLMSVNEKDHRNIHVELMDHFLDLIDFQRKRGDELHYVSGTETHTKDYELDIANHYDYIDAGYHDEFKKTFNGREIWYVHHGGVAGDGQNEGDAYRNWLKRIYFNNLKEKKKQPDLIISAHVHKPIYTSYVQDYHVIHGIILPSWQMKTRFAYRVAPFQRNAIGLTVTEITAGGDIRVTRPLVMETK